MKIKSITNLAEGVEKVSFNEDFANDYYTRYYNKSENKVVWVYHAYYNNLNKTSCQISQCPAKCELDDQNFMKQESVIDKLIRKMVNGGSTSFFEEHCYEILKELKELRKEKINNEKKCK